MDCFVLVLHGFNNTLHSMEEIASSSFLVLAMTQCAIDPPPFHEGVPSLRAKRSNPM